MDVRDSILDCVGRTPLVALDRFAPPEGDRARVLAKMELMNPYSVKDRPALWMLRGAQARGDIAPGRTTIIEATSGNTGIGLAMVATIMGYDLVLCMSEAMSEERKAILRALGARLELTPGDLHTKGAKARALELLEELPDSYYIRQHDNLDNRQAHIDTTAEELWEQTDGGMDAFVAGLGTCGTLTGISSALKPRKPDLLIVGVEPAEAPYYRTGEFVKHRIPGVVPGSTWHGSPSGTWPGRRASWRASRRGRRPGRHGNLLVNRSSPGGWSCASSQTRVRGTCPPRDCGDTTTPHPRILFILTYP